MITVLDHNENCIRPTVISKMGEVRYKVTRKKSNRQAPTIQYESAAPTYGKWDSLLLSNSTRSLKFAWLFPTSHVRIPRWPLRKTWAIHLFEEEAVIILSGTTKTCFIRGASRQSWAKEQAKITTWSKREGALCSAANNRGEPQEVEYSFPMHVWHWWIMSNKSCSF